MSQKFLPPDWLQRLADPYAVLGISVTADNRRLQKRYYQIAKRLHPDHHQSFNPTEKELATQLFTHLVNPAYKSLEQQETRQETKVTLTARALSLGRELATKAPSTRIQDLIQASPKDVDILYEKAIADLAELQYQVLTEYDSLVQHLSELNLVYLYLKHKINEPRIREKRTGLIPAVEAKPIQFTPVTKEETCQKYAQSHYQRATDYARQSNWSQVVRELRDAIQLEPNKSEYYALLGYAYLQQNLPGTSSVYTRQALKLNPKDQLALRCAAKLKMSNQKVNETQNPVKSGKAGGLFGFLVR